MPGTGSSEALDLSCDCGAVTGKLNGASLRYGTHLECFCADCRAAHLYFKQPDPRPGGVHIFQTTPDQITFLTGQEHLRILRLSPKGPFRWYAGCCDVPIGNTLGKPSLPFLGLITDRIAETERLGRIRVRSFVPAASGKAPRHEGMFYMVSRFLFQMARARLSGRWRQTPFFDVETGYPVVKPIVLDRAARTALKAR